MGRSILIDHPFFSHGVVSILSKTVNFQAKQTECNRPSIIIHGNVRTAILVPATRIYSLVLQKATPYTTLLLYYCGWFIFAQSKWTRRADSGLPAKTSSIL